MWKFWKLAPTAVEDAIWRIRWLQDIVKHKADNAQLLQAIFGRIRFDNDTQGSELTNDGEIKSNANSYAKRFVDDINIVACAPEMGFFKDSWGRA